MAQMNCPNCGKTINENDNVCPHCACVLSGNAEKSQKYKGVRPGYGLIVAFIAFAGIAVFFLRLAFSYATHKADWFMLLVAVVAAVIAVFCLGLYISMLKDYKLSQKDNVAFQNHMADMEKQLRDDAEKHRAERERIEAEQTAKLPVCPICGKKNNVKRISTLNRSASVAAWGVASAKIGKQYECTNCKHYF